MNPEVHGKVTCIPEQYLSVTVGDIVFMDSMAFTLKFLNEQNERIHSNNEPAYDEMEAADNGEEDDHASTEQ